MGFKRPEVQIFSPRPLESPMNTGFPVQRTFSFLSNFRVWRQILTTIFFEFLKFLWNIAVVQVRFFIRRSRGETFMKIRALTFRLRRVFFLKNNIAVPVRAYLSFFGCRCRPGDVAGRDSGAGAWYKGVFRSEATPFSRVRARISTCALLTMGNVVSFFYFLYHNLNLMVVEFCLVFWEFWRVG